MIFPPTIRKVNPADTPILVLALTSDTLPLTTVDAYAENILLQKISQISGVGQVGIGGQQKPAVRVQVNPQALAARGNRPRGRAQRHQPGQCRHAQGHAQQSAQDLHHQHQRPAPHSRRYNRLIVAYPQRLTGPHQGTSAMPSTVRERPSRRLVQQGARHPPRRAAPAQRQRHRNVDRIKRCCRSSRPRSRRTSRVTILSGSHGNHPRFGQRRPLHAGSDDRAGGDGDLPVLRNFWATVIPAVTVPLSLIGTFAVLYEARATASTTCR